MIIKDKPWREAHTNSISLVIEGIVHKRQEASKLFSNHHFSLIPQMQSKNQRCSWNTERNTNKGENNGDVLKGILHKAYCVSILFRQQTRCNFVCVICLQSQCSTTALKWMANEGHLYIITADRRIQEPYNVLLRWKERPWSICGSQCN